MPLFSRQQERRPPRLILLRSLHPLWLEQRESDTFSILKRLAGFGCTYICSSRIQEEESRDNRRKRETRQKEREKAGGFARTRAFSLSLPNIANKRKKESETKGAKTSWYRQHIARHIERNKQREIETERD